MRTFAGMGLVLLLEVAAAAALTAWRRRAGAAGGAASQDPNQVTAVLELEADDAVLPADGRAVPELVLAELRTDPMLGLAEVRLVQHVQPTGAGLPERSQVGTSYQGLNDSVARAVGAEPVAAARLTWLALRLDARAQRAAGPILARGGGEEGVRKTLDKAARTASAKLAAAGFRTSMLPKGELASGLASAVELGAGFGGAAGTPLGTGAPGRLVRVGTSTAGTRGPDDGAIGRVARVFTSTSGTLGTRDGAIGRLMAAFTTADHSARSTATIQIAPSGVLVGIDPAHRPVVLGLFRRRPLTATVVGGLHLAQILALRCAAVGARIVIETAREDLWDPILLHSGLDAAQLSVQPVGRVTAPGWPAPTPAAPLLVLRDCGARPPYAATPHGPWTTVVTFLPFLDLRAAGHLAADLVGLQRMPAEEAAVARQLLNLTERDTGALAELPDAMAIWRAKGRAARYCELAPTKWEEAFLGEPSR